jgi:tetratricopeptide (TPR) repeat protein
MTPENAFSANQQNPLIASEDNFSELTAKAVQHIHRGEYAILETYIDDLIERKPFEQNGRRILEELYHSIAKARGLEGALSGWCDRGEHHGAFILRGLRYIELAWLKRGGGFAHTVPKEGMRDFKDYLNKAAADLQHAAEMNPDDPSAAAGVIEVCKGLGVEREIMEAWFEAAVAADPSACRAYENKFEYLTPKWHGNREQLYTFSKWCYDNSPPGSRIYVVLYRYVFEIARFNKSSNEAVWSDPEVKGLLSKVFKRWEKDFPRSDERYRVMGHCQEESGNIPAALENYKKALEIDPDDYGTLLFRGVLYSENLKQYGEARKDFLKILEKNPRDDFVLGHLGQSWLRSGANCITAIKYYNRAINITKRRWMLYYQRAEARNQCGMKKEAIADLDQVVGLNKRDEDVYVFRGRMHADLKNFEAAVRDFDSAIALNGQSDRGFFLRGDSYLKLNRFEEAEADLIKAKQINPSRWAKMADRRLKKIEQKRNAPISAQKTPPKDVPDAATTVEPSKKQKSDVGRKPSEKGVPQDIVPSESDMLRSKAMASWRQNMFKNAAADFQKLLSLKPDDETALYYLGIVACRDKDFKKANEFARKLLTLEADSAAGYRLRGMICQGYKMKDQAVEEYEKSLNLAPDDPERKIALLFLSREMSRRKNYDRAIHYYSQLIDLDPNNTGHLHFRGMAYYRKKDYEKAIIDFTETIQKAKSHGRQSGDYLWRGYCYKKLGMNDKAIGDFREALNAQGSRQSAERALVELGAE